MNDVFDHVQYDRDNAHYFSRVRLEIPTALSSGTVVTAVDGTVFWIENIRGYSTGLTLLTQLLVSPELHTRLGLEVGPSLTGHHHAQFDPAAEFIEVCEPVPTAVSYRLVEVERLALSTLPGGYLLPSLGKSPLGSPGRPRPSPEKPQSILLGGRLCRATSSLSEPT
jgi:hypothetical protein